MPVTIEGLDEVIKKLDKTDPTKALYVGMDWGADEVIDEMKDYPPQTAANRPDEHGRWYERGVGTHSRNAVQRTSENLRMKWKKMRNKSAPSISITNSASYAEYVHGNRQSNVMKKIGWKKVKTVSDKKFAEITEHIMDKYFKDWRNN